MLFGKLLPREGNFFELFNQHARLHRRRRARLHPADPATTPTRTCARSTPTRSATPSAQADRITAEVNRLLHKTFITPIDREQIHGLINAMDDILDLLQDAAETMSLYDVQRDDRRDRCASAT